MWWLSLSSNWTNRTSLSLQASPVSGEANPNVHHGVIRVTKQAPLMHQVTQEQREAAAVGHVVVAQKRSSDLDCELQLTRHRWQLLAALHQQHQYPCQPCASPASLWTNDNPVDQGCTEADQPPFEFLTGGRPGQQRGQQLG